MSIRKLYSINFIVITLVIISVGTVLLHTVSANAQTNWNKYISVDKALKQKNFIDLLFELNESVAKSREQQNYYKKELADIKQDTTPKTNRIVSLRDGGDIFYLYLELLDREQTITITVYNMLGKNVLDVYKARPQPDSIPYQITVSGPPSLPNGVYLCVVTGKNFRLREKFVISRR